jgi:cell division protein FtsI/penicillin-binding protein 2
MKKTLSVSRIRLLFGCAVFVALLLLSRLYLVQMVHGEAFAEQAERQYVRPNYYDYSRGSIFFTDKSGTLVPAAGLTSGFTIAITPDEIKDPEATYQALNAIILINRNLFFAKVAKAGDPYEEILRRISREAADRMSELKLPGVGIHPERWRYYPGGRLAAQTIGFIGFEGDELRGQYGLERYYDEVLTRRGASLYVNFFAELFSNVQEAISAPLSSEGDIVTTIEPSVQAFFENTLANAGEKWGASQVGGIVIDPQTGAIIAMAVSPTYDPNSFKEEPNASIFVNPLVENVFEMGSIVKALTMAAGLDSGVVTPELTYNDRGTLALNSAVISNFDGKARGTVPMQEVLSQSLNTGAAFIALRMGHEKFAEYMRRFGVGEKTGIDLPNETAGLVDNLDSPRDIEHATASFGQGIAFTPIGTARALAVLANGGRLVHPHIVQAVKKKSGLAQEVPQPEPVQVLTPAATEEVTRMLVRVVDEALVDGAVRNPHYTIAAKTGTAQIAKPNGGYYDDRYLHSFFGYAPAFSSRFLVFLYMKEPRGVRYASQTLTEPFMKTMDFLLNYYEVPPDR